MSTKINTIFIFFFLFIVGMFFNADEAKATQAWGSLDSNITGTQNCTSLGGWAWDPDHPNTPNSVHIYHNGGYYDAVMADQFRSDLPGAGVGNGYHAFGYAIPSAWRDGANHTINVYSIDLDGEGNPNLFYSPATVYCPPPTLNNVTISASSVSPDNVTQYNIIVSSTDVSGASNIKDSYALINYQGTNSTDPRGYLTWTWAPNAWPGYQDNRNCSGAGSAAIQPSYGPSYIHLDACSISDSGNTRTVTFTVRFDTSFTTPSINNDISGYTCNGFAQCTGWNNFDINFSLLLPPTINMWATPNPVAYGAAATVNWNSANATACNVNGNGGTTGFFPTGPLTVATTYTGQCFGNGSPANGSVTVNVTPPPHPTCTSATPDGDWTIATSGFIQRFVSGVTSDTVDLWAPTWTTAIVSPEVNTNDDIVWYHLGQGVTNLGAGLWRVDVNLNPPNHPGFGGIAVHIYPESTYWGMETIPCDSASFIRLDKGDITVNSNIPAQWDITCPLTNPACPAVNSGAFQTTATYATKPDSTWTITPRYIPGYNWQVTGCAVNTPCPGVFQ